MALANLRPPCEEAAARAAPETPGCAAHAKRWVLAATVLASSLVFLEATVINVALPAIQQALDASVGMMQWIASTYTLALAALTMVCGALGDRFGRRRMLLIGLSLFAVASLAGGLAANGTALIIARALQGIGAAVVTPNSLAHLSASFPRAERGRALGVWSAASSLTGSAAPLLGGWLVDAVSWRAVLLVGVPVAVAALGVCVARLPENRAPRAAATLDILGASLATLAFASVTAGLIGASGGAPSAVVWVLLLTGFALLAGFIWFESRIAEPMMPPEIFRVRTFSAANLLTFLVYFAVPATFFLLPFTLVQAYGYSATLTGAVFLPFAVVMGTLSRWAGGLTDRWGAKRPLILGPLMLATGLALFAYPFGDGSYWQTFVPPMAVVGLGMALIAAPITAVVMGAVGNEQAGVASGINSTVARLAGLLAVTIAGLVAVAVFDTALGQRIAAVDAAPAVKQALLAQRHMLGGTPIPPDAGAAAAALQRALRAALVDAFRVVVLLSVAFAIAGAGVAAIAIDVPAIAGDRRVQDAPLVCEHLAQVVTVAPRSEGCEACLRDGSTWIHLRLCLACGYVGCCDASARQHATQHFHATGHPVVQSLAAGEAWRWCYVDERVV